MCGYDLRAQQQRRRRISWVDALLVLAVLGVLVFWWQMGSRNRQESAEAAQAEGIMPGDIPILDPTAVPTDTPEPTPTPTPLPQRRNVTHTVRSGETLLSIAGQYDLTVEEIQAANNLANELIRAGDELIIPVLSDEPALVAAEGATSEFSYTVAEGDTIISIANRVGSTVNDILAANSLSQNDFIRPGDVLVIPVRGVPGQVVDSADAAPAPSGGDEGAPASTVYIAPRLVSPADGETIARTDSVLLSWVSVEVLAPNEWYVLLLYPSDGAARAFPSIWTKATSHRLGAELAPAEGQSAAYTWQVSVVRVTTGPDGRRILEAASPPSDLRRFSWQ